MTLDTIAGSNTGNSYNTFEEASAYFRTRDGFDFDEWEVLTDAQIEQRLSMASILMNGLSWRGVKASATQALAFPRFFPGDPFWDMSVYRGCNSLLTWENVVARAEELGVDVPGIPAAVKIAHLEITFQVVHSHLITLDPYGDGKVDVTSIGIGGNISVALGSSSSGQSTFSIWNKESMDALSYAKGLLAPYMERIRGAVV